jgi:hypothetical protein
VQALPLLARLRLFLLTELTSAISAMARQICTVQLRFSASFTRFLYNFGGKRPFFFPIAEYFLLLVMERPGNRAVVYVSTAVTESRA